MKKLFNYFDGFRRIPGFLLFPSFPLIMLLSVHQSFDRELGDKATAENFPITFADVDEIYFDEENFNLNSDSEKKREWSELSFNNRSRIITLLDNTLSKKNHTESLNSSVTNSLKGKDQNSLNNFKKIFVQYKGQKSSIDDESIKFPFSATHFFWQNHHYAQVYLPPDVTGHYLLRTFMTRHFDAVSPTLHPMYSRYLIFTVKKLQHLLSLRYRLSDRLP